MAVFFCGLEATSDVEPEIDVVRAASTRELTERRAEAVREIQLQGVSTRTLFYRDAPFRAIWVVAGQARYCP